MQNTSDGASEGQGGGIVHAVVELGPTATQRSRAEAELRRRVPGATVAGPLVFRQGRFGLVSSFQEDNGEFTRRVVGLGSAPVLEGDRAAVSIQLTRLGAKVLWESFQSATPDVTFHFEMEIAGYRAPKRALIEADLDRVYEHRVVNDAVATPVLQAEIRDAFEELRDSAAIRLTQVGEDETLEALVETAYSKLTDLIFEPAGAEKASLSATSKAPSALDRATALLDKSRKEARADQERLKETLSAIESAGYDADAFRANFPEFFSDDAPEPPEDGAEGAVVAAVPLPDLAAVSLYQRKRSRQKGTYRVDLNKYTADTLSLRFDQNVGDLTEHLADPEVFRSVNLDDPLYRQREIVVALQGVGDAAFEDEIAFVNVQLRKDHESGDSTIEDLTIDRSSFNRSGNRFAFVYGWKGDSDRAEWNRYSHRAVWGIHGGEAVEGPWKTTDASVIPLIPPFSRRTIQLEVFEEEALRAAGVRSVSVRVGAGGDARVRQTTLNTTRGQLSGELSFVSPADQLEYEYEIQWRLRGNRSVSSGVQRTDQEILYIDPPPEG